MLLLVPNAVGACALALWRLRLGPQYPSDHRSQHKKIGQQHGSLKDSELPVMPDVLKHFFKCSFVVLFCRCFLRHYVDSLKQRAGVPYLAGQGDVVSRLITPITYIVTPFIPIINLLTKSPWTLPVQDQVEATGMRATSMALSGACSSGSGGAAPKSRSGPVLPTHLLDPKPM